MQHKVIIAGAGPAGLAAAALLARDSVDVAVVAPIANPDGRTTALMEPSLRLLEAIGLWPSELQMKCAPLKELHIIDDIGNTVSAPPLAFSSSELNLDAFGWNVPMIELTSALEKLCDSLGVTRYHTRIAALSRSTSQITVNGEDSSEILGQLLVAADGGNSTVRKLANVSLTETKYEQAAMVARFAHSVSHKNISTEWHKSAGPFTTVPLPGKFSSLVWMARPDEIARLAKLSPESLAKEIQLESHGALGKISDVANVHVIPMFLRAAVKLTGQRLILIGEAAHQMPPIGAQGLNLSLRDAGHVADIVMAHDDPGTDESLAEYASRRRSETYVRQTSVGMLNWSLLTDFAPASIARAATLAAIGTFPPLRNFALRSGIAENANLPFAMRKV